MNLGEGETRQRKHIDSCHSFSQAGDRVFQRTAVMDTTGRGVLDTPQVRIMAISYAAMLLLLAILHPGLACVRRGRAASRQHAPKGGKIFFFLGPRKKNGGSPP